MSYDQILDILEKIGCEIDLEHCCLATGRVVSKYWPDYEPPADVLYDIVLRCIFPIYPDGHPFKWQADYWRDRFYADKDYKLRTGLFYAYLDSNASPSSDADTEVAF